MAMVEFKIQGVDALTARMRALPVELRKKPAARTGQAAKVIREQAQANARQLDDPETGRAIADNIVQRLRSRYNRRTGDVMISGAWPLKRPHSQGTQHRPQGQYAPLALAGAGHGEHGRRARSCAQLQRPRQAQPSTNLRQAWTKRSPV